MPAVVIGGIASMAVSVVWSFWFPSIRNVDRFDDLPVPDAGSIAGTPGS